MWQNPKTPSKLAKFQIIAPTVKNRAPLQLKPDCSGKWGYQILQVNLHKTDILLIFVKLITTVTEIGTNLGLEVRVIS